MRYALPVLTAVLGSGLGFAIPQQAALQTSDEPALQFELRIDGVKHTLTEGQKHKLIVAGKEHDAVIKVTPYRHFAAAGIQFDYPHAMPFGFEAGHELTTWTLDGQDLTILIYQFEAGEPDEMARLMLKSTADVLDADAKIREQTRKLAGKKRTVLSCDLSMARSKMLTSSFGLKASGKTCVIMLQDNATGSGKPSAEAIAMDRLFATTLRIRDN